MDINFTGIKNMYGIRISVAKVTPASDILSVKDRTYLAMQLTDDVNGADFSEFKKAAATTDLKNFYHPVYPDFLNIKSYKLIDLTNAVTPETYKLFINNHSHPIHINDKNLKFFTYLAKLLKKIQQIPVEKFPVSRSFINEGSVHKSLFLGRDPAPNTYQIIRHVFSPLNVKAQAHCINDNLQKIMLSYFGIQ